MVWNAVSAPWSRARASTSGIWLSFTPGIVGASLANALVAAQPQATASELLATFEAARAALESAAASETASGTSEPALDGPKRRFTWVHALLAAIILALTLWHYLGR